MTKQPLGGRPSKAALAKMKLATIVVSIVAFAGTLGGVAYLNPAMGQRAGAASQTQPSGSVSTSGTATAQISTNTLSSSSRQQTQVAPLVRTRGS